MNTNLVVTDNWSNPESEDLYNERWPDESSMLVKQEKGEECRTCSFWARLDPEWGLCANPKSRHRLETVFEHFTCPSYVEEGLGPHSFTENSEAHCRCGGRGSKYLDRLSMMLEEIEPEADPEDDDPIDWPEGLFDTGEQPEEEPEG